MSHHRAGGTGRRGHHMRQVIRSWSVAFFVVTTAISLGAAHAWAFERLVIFGDSLSDPGNHFIAFGTTSRQPFEPIPEASYAIGGHHFSNGATWVEQLTETLNQPTSGKPALRVPGKFTNYAVGRARARFDPFDPFPFYDLRTQVSLFLSDFGGHASSTTNLYVI